jgi:hypothetical protein
MGNDEFLGCYKAEKDALIHDLRNIIIYQDLHGYCCGGSRVDWDDLVSGDMRGFLGDVERSASHNALSGLTDGLSAIVVLLRWTVLSDARRRRSVCKGRAEC